MSCKRQAGAQHHGVAVARAGMGRGGGEIGASVAAGGENGHLGAEAVDLAGGDVERDDAAAAPLLHDQVEGEILDEEVGLVADRLAIHGVQHGMAGAVRGRAGALGDALAVIGGHAAERALVDLAFLGARERHAPMLELVDGGRRVAHEVFDGILVAEPVRPFDGVVHVPAPIVRTHVAERGRDAALRRHRVRARREHLGDAGRAQARLRAADGGAQASPAGPDHHYVEGMVDDRIGGAVRLRGGVAVSLGGAVFLEHPELPRSRGVLISIKTPERDRLHHKISMMFFRKAVPTFRHHASAPSRS